MLRKIYSALICEIKKNVAQYQELLRRIRNYIYLAFANNSDLFVLDRRYFDEDWYLAEHRDVGEYKDNLSKHFLHHGISEGRSARFFDSLWYLDNNEDLRESKADAWAHYKNFGRYEGREARFIYITSKTVHERPDRTYGEWVRLYDSRKISPKDWLRAETDLNLTARVSLVLVVSKYDVLSTLRETVIAIREQFYGRWECFLSLPENMPDALRLDIENLVSTDERFRLQSSNDTLSDSEIVNRLALLATGDYIACISSSDCLDPSALFWIAQAQGQIKNCAVIYSDEDRIARDGTRNSPYFKPQFNYELLLSHNVLGSFTVFNRDLWTRLDGLDTSLASDSLYDLIFRAFEVVGANGFVHVPRILNHVAGLKGRDTADKEIVARHLRRTGRSGDVFRVEEASGYNRVRYTLPELLPLVTIIIPTRDRVDILKICVDSVLQSTTYKNFEIIIIDNGSEESKTFAYFETLPSPKVRVLRDNKPFNFSALNNDAVSVAWGDYVCLMNNDIEILTPGWLEEMMSFAIQPDIGCVGARLWYPDETIQHAGVLIGFHGVAGHMHKFTKRGKTGYADRIILHQSLSAVTAAVMLVKKALYEEVGGFDESLAVAFNDVDFCLKLRNAGYRNIYTPYAEMIHYESASRGAEDSPEKKAREALEIGIIKARYGESLLEDPAYNPNLSLVSEDLSLAFPPRVKGLPEILKAKKSTF